MTLDWSRPRSFSEEGFPIDVEVECREKRLQSPRDHEGDTP